MGNKRVHRENNRKSTKIFYKFEKETEAEESNRKRRTISKRPVILLVKRSISHEIAVIFEKDKSILHVKHFDDCDTNGIWLIFHTFIHSCFSVIR